MKKEEKSLQRQLKYKLLMSYLIGKDKKEALIHELPSLSTRQQMDLMQVILEAESEAEVLIHAGFQSKLGKDFLSKLRHLHKKLKKETFAAIEKSESDAELQQLGHTLNL